MLPQPCFRVAHPTRRDSNLRLRQSFGDRLGDERVVQVAHEAVDDFLVRQNARVITFVPVLAMRRIRERIDSVLGDAVPESA